MQGTITPGLPPPKRGLPGFGILGDLKILDLGRSLLGGLRWGWKRGGGGRGGGCLRNDFANAFLRSMTRSRRGVFVESKSLF